MSGWTAHILTLFPDMFPGPLEHSIAGKALLNGLWSLKIYNIRDFSQSRHNVVDDTPFGGGPGMVLKADVIHRALEHVSSQLKNPKYIYLSPRGTPLTQEKLDGFVHEQDVVMLCGHYEGVDERVLDEWPLEEVSIGDYVLSGGEVAAMVLVDGVVRLLDHVVGKADSLEEESFRKNLLEYPQYTKPQLWKDRKVPDVLLSGHHRLISQWRLEQAERITKQRRPDLWERYCHSKV
jgi:tRNA (guanine37-N1)-methyltransferase